MKALENIFYEFTKHLIKMRVIESTSDCKNDLLNLALKADDLKKTIRALGDGALLRLNTPIDDCKNTQNAKPSELPQGKLVRVTGRGDWDGNWGNWINSLQALSELSRFQAGEIEKMAGMGGRKSLAEHIHGTADGWLASVCTEFAEAHGCRTQAVPLQMVQAIMKADLFLDVKPSSGRKAIRKVAQTKQSKGPV